MKDIHRTIHLNVGSSIVRVGILGPLVVDEGAPSITPQQRTLLSVLALEAPRPASTDLLIEAIWGTGAPTTAKKALQGHIAVLRRTFPEGSIATEAAGYVLRVRREDVDVRSFEDNVREARNLRSQGHPADAARLLEGGLALWRGDPLPDLLDCSLGITERLRLMELKSVAEDELFDLRLEKGEHTDLVPELEYSVAVEPLRERRWAQLMLALYRSGRQADSLAAYRRLATRLDDELGIAPSVDLVALEESIVLQRPELQHSTSDKIGFSDQRSSRAMTEPESKLPAELGQSMQWPMYGRVEESLRLQGCWQESLTSGRRSIFVSGESGIGKTRLAADLASEVLARGGNVLYGRCDEDLDLAYAPFGRAIDTFFTTHGHLDRSEMSFLDQVSGRMEGSQQRSGIPLTAVPEEPERTPDEINRWLTDRTLEAPIMFVVDDLQWASPSTIRALRRIVTSAEPASLLVLALYRDTDLAQDHPLRHLLAEVRPEHHVTRLALAGVVEDDVVSMCASSSLPADQIAPLAHSIFLESSGNPLFVHELLEHLSDRAALGETASPDAGLDLPQSIKDVIGRRADALPTVAQAVLKIASVVGLEFDFSVVAAVVGDYAEAVEGLDRAVSAGLIEDAGVPSKLRFSHALIRRTMYDQQTSVRRSQLHGEIAAAIEALPYPLEPRAGLLAEHYSRAPIEIATNKTPYYCAIAALWSLQRLAPDDALRFTEMGLGVLETLALPDRALSADLRLFRARAAYLAGDVVESRNQAAAAGEDALVIGSAPRLVAAAKARTWHATAGLDDPLVPMLCEQALQLTSGHDPRVESAALAVLAFYMVTSGPSCDEAPELARRSVALAREVRSDELLWEALYASTISSWGEDAPDRRGDIQEMIELSARLPMMELSVLSTLVRGVVRLEHGDREGFDSDLADVERIAAASPSYWLPTAVAGAWRCMIAMAEGRLDDAQQLNDEMGTVLPPSDSNFHTIQLAQLFAIRRLQGRLDELLPVMERLNEQVDLPVLKTSLALTHAITGDYERARQTLGVMFADEDSHLRRDATWSSQLAMLAEAAILSNATSLADRLYVLLKGRSGTLLIFNPGAFCGGAADRYLGSLAAMLGRPDEARERFERAIALERRIGAPALVEQTIAAMRLPRNNGN
jgi:DNA-binding SARP family transcriptional activator